MTAATLPVMGKKKPDGREPGDSGRHKTPRKNLGLPEDWFNLAQRLAREGKPTPTVWWLIELIAEAAIRAGVKESELPVRPWERRDT